MKRYQLLSCNHTFRLSGYGPFSNRVLFNRDAILPRTDARADGIDRATVHSPSRSPRRRGQTKKDKQPVTTLRERERERGEMGEERTREAVLFDFD